MKTGALKYARFNIFRSLLWRFSAKTRERRMSVFTNTMKPSEGMRIVDLGGTPEIWQLLDVPLDLTIVNLPGMNSPELPESRHQIRFVEGDACDEGLLAGSRFDMVFSNSVIEHVGDENFQAAFAKVVHRLSDNYWVQTPSKLFPIEAHNGMPFWWFYPGWLKRYYLSRWAKKLPDWTKSIEETRVLSQQSMEEFFPGSQVFIERVIGIPKSIVNYKC